MARKFVALALLLVFAAVQSSSQGITFKLSENPAVNDDLQKQGKLLLEKPNELERSMCLIPRRPEITRDPDLYFFSRKINSLHISLDLTADMWDGKEPDFGLKARQEREIKQKLLDKELYNKNLDTYFILHGFLASSNDTWMHALKDRILGESDANVFLVDWSGGSRPKFLLDYGLVVVNSYEVTNYIVAFIKSLVNVTSSTNLDNFHLIGYSLGAQMLGFIGDRFNGTIGRITALDPAGPCFRRNSEHRTSLDTRLTGYLESPLMVTSKRRLSASSAKQVVAIHTDIKALGLNENCAHYDIYINGGAHQVNCTEDELGCNHNACLRPVLSPAPLMKMGNESNEKENSEKCYLMAYLCSSWQAYQAGECAYCKDSDARCTFTGLSLGPYPHIGTDPNLWQGSGLDQSDVPLTEPNPDLIFNREIITSAPNQRIDNPYDLRDSARHFTKIGIEDTICLYQYQVLIAADATNDRDVARDTKFYLRIPLILNETQNLYDSRFVQVSHLVSKKSQSRSTIEESLSHQTGYPLTDKLLDFYTALITFNSTNDCADIQSDRVLCKPLEIITRTQLYSSNPDGLRRVQYVALNYLSGLKKSNRDAKSQLLHPVSNGEVSTENPLNLLKPMLPWPMACLFDNDQKCNPLGDHIDIVSKNESLRMTHEK